MKITKLLLGTGNPTKIEYYKRYLSDLPLELVTTKELNLNEPEETGNTIEENAWLKAKHYFKESGLPTLADDAGFEIPALNNFPGTHTHRFAGYDMSDKEVIEGIIDKMEGLKDDERKGQFKVALALALSENEIITSVGSAAGIVPEKPYDKVMPHFPYRSLLFIPQFNKWFYDLTDEEEERLGYRAAAVKKIKKQLQAHMKYSPEEIQEKLKAFTGWELAGGSIVKTFSFDSFDKAMKAVNQVAIVAESLNHHPDIDIRYNKLTFRLFTHSENGITDKDFALAKEIEQTAVMTM
jgi:non-canonical purine NTP pyrophosphatase (RdgB/HAM1 family)